MRNNNEEKCLFGVILRLISSKYEDEASSHSAKPLRSEGVKNFIPFSRHNFRFQLYIRKMIVFVDITVFSVLRALFVEQTTKKKAQNRHLQHIDLIVAKFVLSSGDSCGQRER